MSTEKTLSLSQKNKLGIYVGIVILTSILATAAFIAFNGFDTWKTNMNSAAVYLNAANTTSTYIHNGGGGGGGGDTGTQQMIHHGALLPTPVAAGTATTTGQGGQYMCPTCGATGLPNYSINGAPVCHICGRDMTVKRF